ncbi:threonylcarbamoyl-AMP synthase [bacterium]|nr:threonylcarbamoyl-AMP synthase [bacterium]
MNDSLKEEKIFSVDADNPDKKIILKAAYILNNGGLVVFPTETVYGIAVKYGDKSVENKLYKVKNRNIDKPFTIHISDISFIKKLDCFVPDEAYKLMKKYWPGPLTLVLPLKSKQGKQGFRVPAHPAALALIDAAGGGVIASSANISVRKSPVTVEQAYEQLADKIDIYLDSGKTGYGKDSTVVDFSGDKPVVLREGVLKNSDIFNSF